MKWLTYWLWGIIAVAGMLFAAQVAAASGSLDGSGGRITFTGAIVEATCAASIDADLLMREGRTAAPHRLECGGTRTAAASSGRFYSLTVVDLDAATIDDDRVLGYFAGYMKDAGSNEAKVKLVTQSFE